VRFSRARRRYERQGVLVDEAALARAEAECLSDADARAAGSRRTVYSCPPSADFSRSCGPEHSDHFEGRHHGVVLVGQVVAVHDVLA